MMQCFDPSDERDRKNVILIGLPSSGKSTVGVLLAKHLGYRFLDADLLIQEREGKLLHELISERGVDGFLDVENEVNASIDVSRTVISTGGSVVYCEEAMEHLRSIGKVILLSIDFETMKARLGDYTHRGIVSRTFGELADIYAERAPLYEKYAHATVHVSKEATLTDTVEGTLAVCKDLLNE